MNHAQHAAIGMEDWHAHHRPDPAIVDALTGVEPAVGEGIGREDRLSRPHHPVDERQTQPERARLRRALDLAGPQHKPFRFFIGQQHKGPVGLMTNSEHALQQAGQHFLQRERSPNGPIESQHRPQFRLSLPAGRIVG